MHSFPQFTRSSLAGFAWVEAIIFEGHFMLRGELPGRSFVRGQLFGGGQFSSGAIILGDNYPGIDHPGGNFRGGNYPDTYI